MHDLPYVDPQEIGVTGHSNGARAANWSVPIDNEAEQQLIAAVLLVDNDPVYVDADFAYTNIYGSRDVGVIAAQYDHTLLVFYLIKARADHTILDDCKDSALHWAAFYEHRIRKGQKPIFHLEAFAAKCAPQPCSIQLRGPC